MKMIFLVDGDNNIGTGLQGIDLLTEEDTVLVLSLIHIFRHEHPEHH